MKEVVCYKIKNHVTKDMVKSFALFMLGGGRNTMPSLTIQTLVRTVLRRQKIVFQNLIYTEFTARSAALQTALWGDFGRESNKGRAILSQDASL